MADPHKIEQDKLLFLKVLQKEASKQEIEYLDRNYSQIEQRKILEELVDFGWKESNYSNYNHEVFSQIRERLRLKVMPPKQIQIKFDFYYISKIAAVFIIFLSVSFILFNNLSYHRPEVGESTGLLWMTTETGFGEKRIITLPDGSKVHLNYNSKITYPNNFGNGNRLVKLSGEAYFDVTHNPGLPFIVESSQLKVKVLGTTFNFNSISNEVALNEGKVEVSKENHHLILTDGEKAEVLDGQLLKSSYDLLEYLAWKDGVIYIENKSFAEILSILEKWYGVSFTVPSAINQDRIFSGNFNNRSLSNILYGLCFSLNCSFEINNKNVTLYAKK